jgi:hypothetical protein
MAEQGTGGNPGEPSPDDRAADTITRWLVVLLVGPVLIIATGYVVSLPIQLAFSIVHFHAQAHPILGVLVRIAILGLWIATAAWLIRIVWPKRKPR